MRRVIIQRDMKLCLPLLGHGREREMGRYKSKDIK
jgi:hypothetical protein